MSYPKEYLAFCSTIASTLTSLRKSVLFSLWKAQRPLKAYEILEILSKENAGIQPASVYRALDFFLKAGAVHKIESIQSFTLCTEPEKQHPSELLMVCNHCHRVQEVYDKSIRNTIMSLAAENGFELGKESIELKGCCQDCVHNP